MVHLEMMAWGQLCPWGDRWHGKGQLGVEVMTAHGTGPVSGAVWVSGSRLWWLEHLSAGADKPLLVSHLGFLNSCSAWRTSHTAL